MRRKDKMISNKTELEEILNSADTIRIAMIDGDRPYIVPMSFGYSEDKIYIHGALKGRKIDVIKANPNVCFEVELDTKLVTDGDACEWSYHFKSIIGDGQAYIVDDFDEKVKALDLIMEHYGSKEHSYPEKAVNGTAVIRIDITEMVGKKSPVE